VFMRKTFLFIVLCIMVFGVLSCKQAGKYVRLEGSALGTTYAITYKTPAGSSSDLSLLTERSILKCFEKVNNSLSIYNNHSLISRINRNLTQETDSLFRTVFERSCQITADTDGAFDISAAPFFDLWGFGLEKRDGIQPEDLEEIRRYVGMDKFRLEGMMLYKSDPRCRLSMNAIAKGYTCDLVATELTALGITDLLVEIGGEIVCKGLNPKNKPWRIGIDSPIDGNINPGEKTQTVIGLTDKALATSGNYRNYYIIDGEKFAHIIDPKTGCPVKHNLLSATVIANDCMTADAYATAFMVMGLEASIHFLERHPGMEAFLIYDENGVFKTYATDKIINNL